MERKGLSGFIATHKVGANLQRAKITSPAEQGTRISNVGGALPPLAIAHSASYKMAIALGSLHKVAASTGNRGSGVLQTGGGVSRLAPEIYSPLYQFANLNLPRDRITMNAWNRAFYQTNPYVKNAITLHATYPVSKINIKCKDPKIEEFFNDMSEDLNLSEIVYQIALEYWINGEAFVYSEFDENRRVWSKIVIQNPDYMVVKKAIIASDPVLFLRPDNRLQQIATSSNPIDAKLKEGIPDWILHYARNGAPIPLNNFNISHLKSLAQPYDIRGTSIIVSIYKDLMLYDKLRECYSIDTDVLTRGGFKKYDEITDKDEIATFNAETKEIEYHPYIRRTDYEYSGKMYHFNSGTMDVCVTPNHRMWLANKKGHESGYGDFHFIRADGVSDGTKYRSRSIAEYNCGENIEHVNVLGFEVPIREYLKFLAFVITEGYCRYDCDKSQYVVGTCQKKDTEHHKDFQETVIKFANYIEHHCCSVEFENTTGFCDGKISKMWHGRIYGKDLAEYIYNEIGSGSKNKRIPEWIKNLSKELLQHFLSCLLQGDGSVIKTASKPAYRYYTISEELANDVQEIVFKCGYSSYLRIDKNGDGREFYLLSWSDSNYGDFPVIHNNSDKSANIDKIDYNDRVFCFEVPNGLFVTRRNGLIAIQGNSKFCQADSMVNPITLVKVGGNAEGEYRPSPQDLEFWKNMFEEAQYDKDFKIFTHQGVDVQRVGYNGAVLDIQADLEFITKNIMVGLMIPPSLLDQEWASYSSASVGLEVLRDRYMSFRNMLKRWLERKIFAPISKAQGFYETKRGKKRLIVPEIEWNKMNLYDLDSYTNVLVQLNQAQPAKVSKHTLYRSLDLNYEEEKIRLREEMIDDIRSAKESAELQQKTISELRSINPEEIILEEPQQVFLPGQIGAPGGGGLGMGSGMGGLGGPELGGGLAGPLGGELGGGMPGGLGLGGPEAGGGGAPPGGAPPGGALPGGGGVV